MAKMKGKLGVVRNRLASRLKSSTSKGTPPASPGASPGKSLLAHLQCPDIY
jgi:hypothetical protein